MGSVRAELAADVARAIALYEETFSWTNADGEVRAGIPCVRRDQPTADELQETGGYIEQVDYVLIVAKSEFPGGLFPQSGDPVNADRDQIRSVAGHQDPAAPALKLYIGSVEE